MRERIGIAEEKAVLPESVATAGDAIRWLKARGEGYAAAFEREDIIRVAIDQTHAQPRERQARAKSPSSLQSPAGDIAFRSGTVSES